MRQIKILAPYEDYRAGDTPTVLGSRGRQLVGLGVAEWVLDPAPMAAAKKAPAKKAAPRAKK